MRLIAGAVISAVVRIVAYDDLADRVRVLLSSEANLTENRIFGGLAFLIGGNMAVTASGQGGVPVRVDPAKSNTLVATTGARLVEMRGRAMPGWLRVELADMRTKRRLAKWVGLGKTYARSLTPKAVDRATTGRVLTLR